MISVAIAEGLRHRGHDVEAVAEHSELRGMTDAELFEYTQTCARAVVTYNRDDFLELDRRSRSQGEIHSGIVILNPRRFPQGAVSVGPLIASLAHFLAAGPPYAAFIHWLQ